MWLMGGGDCMVTHSTYLIGEREREKAKDNAGLI